MKNVVSVQFFTSLLFGLNATAATLSWNGTAGGNWNTSNSWLDGVTPATWNSVTPDNAFFGATGAGQVNLTAGTTAGGITFDNAGYTIAGNTLTLSNSTITTNADATISSPLAGSTGLTKAGTGKLTLGSTPGYTGTTTVNNGTLQFPYSSGYSNPTAINSPGALNLTSTAQIIGSTSLLFSGNGPLTIAGTANNRMILQGTGSTSYTGDITIKTASILEPRSFFSATSGNSVTVESGGELRIQFDPTSINGLNGNGVVQSVSGAATLTMGKANGSGIFTGTMKNNGSAISLIKTGTGTQELSGPNIGNTALGAMTLTNGTLKLTQATAWSSDVTMDNANMVNLQLNAPNSGDSWTYSKKILAGASANAMIEKVGSGTVILNPAAASTFGGTAANAVQVTAGTLYVNSALNATAPKATVNGGTLGGKSSLGDTVVASGGAIEGGQAGTGTLTLNRLTFNDTGALRVSPAASYVPVVVNNALTVNGTITVNIANAPALGATYHLMQFTGAPAGGGSFVLPLSRNPYTLAINGTFLDLVVGNTAVFPVWTGTQSSEWSLNAIAGSKNWKQSTDNAPTDFLALDSVIFDDSATTTTPDISVANVSPGGVTFNNTNKNFTLSGTFGIASGTLAKTGSGSLTINNVNTYSGATTLNSGTLAFVSGGLGSSTVTFTGNSTLQWLGGNSSGVPLAINTGVTATLDTGTNNITETTVGGTGALSKTGTGTLTLDGSSTLAGTTVSQGNLQLNAAAGAGTITLGDANTGANNIQFVLGNTAADTGLAGNITVASSGTGTATLKVADNGSNPSGTGTMTLNRATTLDGSAITNGNGYYLSSRTFAGTGTLHFAGAAGKRFILLNSSSAFTGDITIQSGILEPRNTLNTTTGSNMTVASGAELRTDGNLTVNALNGAGTVQAVNFSPSTLTVGQNGGSGSFTGILRNNGQVLSLIKSGSGTQILSGSNSYTGTTNVNNGLLVVEGTTGTGNVTVAPGATVSGYGTISGDTTVNGNITPGGPDFETITVKDLTLGTTAKAVCQIDKTGTDLTNDQVYLTNGVTYGGTLEVIATGSALEAGDSFRLFDAWTYSGTFTTYNLPALETGLGWDTSGLATDGTLRVVVTGGYDSWAIDKNLTAANNGKSQDPDHDGVTNLVEYALGGDPLSSADNGVNSGAIRDFSGTPVLTLTIAVRAGAVFAPGANNSQTVTIDGIVYRIEGSTDLISWTSAITEVEVTPALIVGLPTVPSGFEYHTFRTTGPVSSAARGFVRAFVSETP